VTLYDVADFLAKEGDLRPGREVWSQSRERTGLRVET